MVEPSPGNQRAKAENRSLASTGLVTCPFMPASMQRLRSSAKALAVMASMGTDLPASMALILRVASKPSMTGICISIKIKS